MIPDYEGLYKPYVGKFKITQNGRQAIGLCPFHEDHHPSLSMNIETGCYFCHSCGAKGNAYQFAVEKNHPNPKQYINGSTDNFGSFIKPPKNGEIKVSKPSIIDHDSLREEARRFFQNLLDNPDYIPMNWNKEVIKGFTIGLDGDKLNFPQFDNNKRCVNNKRHKWIQSKDGDTSCKWYPSEFVIREYDHSKPLYICEGEKDAITIYCDGKQAITSTNGARSIPEDLSLLKAFDSCTIIYDNDKAGNEGAEKLAERMVIEFGKPVKIAQWRNGLHDGYDISDDAENGFKEMYHAVTNAREYEEDKVKTQQADQNREYKKSDMGNAEYLCDLFGEKIRYNHTIGKWNIWEGQYWKPDRINKIYQLAKDSARKRQAKALTILDTQQKGNELKFSVYSENYGKLTSALKSAQSIPKIASIHENWDADPYYFQCNNGVLNLYTGELMKGKPEWMISQSGNVKYDPDAECPTWDESLKEWMSDDEEMIQFIYRALGYSLTGLTDEQVMFLNVGSGANGKSVFQKVMAELWSDYHTHSRFDAFEKKFSSSNTNDLARLHNARVVTTNETGERKKLDEERLKEIVGGDSITARFLNHEYFTYQSKVKLWAATNNLPKVEDFSDGFWRRMIVIKWVNKFKGENRDPGLFDELKSELSGILNRVIQGLMEWHNQKLNPPEKVMNATEEYRIEEDVVAQFIADCVTVVGEYEVIITAKQMYERYKEWHEENADGKPLSIQAFGRRMNQLGHKSEKIGGVKKYLGLEAGL